MSYSWQVPSFSFQEIRFKMLPRAFQKSNKIKNLINGFFRLFGYDLRKFDVAKIDGFLGFDLFHDIAELLKGKSVTVLDIGACDGRWISEMAKQFDYIETYLGFEPDSRVSSELRKRVSNIVNLGSFHISSFGVGSKNETLKFNLMNSPSMNSFLELGKEGWGRVEKSVAVELVTLDSFDPMRKLAPDRLIDILKIDAQGYDFEVLRGADKLLTGNKINLVQCEVNFQFLYDSVIDFGELLDYMNERGYRLFGTYYPHYRNARLAWFDALFISENFLSQTK